jgi:hypothetical protein
LKFESKKGPYVVFLPIAAINLNATCPYTVRNQKNIEVKPKGTRFSAES